MSGKFSSENIKQWFLKNANHPKAIHYLSIFTFVESFFAPLPPPDPFLMGILLVKKEKWFKYSLIVSIASVLGAVFGYLIGFAFYDIIAAPIVSHYGLEAELVRIHNLFMENAFWSIFVGAFTLIPFEIFTIGAGLFGINIWIFILASLIGRTLRFLIVGLIMRIFGDGLSKIIFRYFNLATILIAILIIIYILLKLS